MMDNGDLETFGAFVVVSIVEGLDVKENGEAVVLAGFRTFGNGVEPVGPVRVWTVGNGGEIQLGSVPTKANKMRQVQTCLNRSKHVFTYQQQMP